MSAVQSAIAELARILGEPPEAIHPENPRWLRLLQEGVIVRLTLRRWRAKTTLDLVRDLGLPPNGEQYREILELGRKLLLPREILSALDSVDSAARQNLKKFGYETYWGIFVPATAYNAWKEENEKYKEKYFELCEYIVEYYDDMLTTHLAQFEAAARAAWRRFRLLSASSEDEDFSLDENEFVARYVARLRALIPSAEEIRARFAYEVHLSYVPLPSLLAQDARQAAWIQAEREAAEYVERTRTEMRQAWNEAERAITVYRREQMDLIRRDVLATAQAEKEKLIDHFLVDVARQLRALIYDTVVSAYETTARRGAVHGRTVSQLRLLLEQVQQLNFFGDREVDAMCDRIRGLIGGTTEHERNDAEIQDVLRNVALVLKASLLALGDEERGARTAGTLPATVTPQELHRARRALQLDVEIQNAPGIRRQRVF